METSDRSTESSTKLPEVVAVKSAAGTGAAQTASVNGCSSDSSDTLLAGSADRLTNGVNGGDGDASNGASPSVRGASPVGATALSDVNADSVSDVTVTEPSSPQDDAADRGDVAAVANGHDAKRPAIEEPSSRDMPTRGTDSSTDVASSGSIGAADVTTESPKVSTASSITLEPPTSSNATSIATEPLTSSSVSSVPTDPPTPSNPSSVTTEPPITSNPSSITAEPPTLLNLSSVTTEPAKPSTAPSSVIIVTHTPSNASSITTVPPTPSNAPTVTAGPPIPSTASSITIVLPASSTALSVNGVVAATSSHVGTGVVPSPLSRGAGPSAVTAARGAMMSTQSIVRSPLAMPALRGCLASASATSVVKPSPPPSLPASPVSVSVKAPSTTLRPMAGLLFDLGLDLAKQQVYKDLIRIQTRKQSRGRLGRRELQQLDKLRLAHKHMCRRNAPLKVDGVRCPRCAYFAGSTRALRVHDVSGTCSSSGDHSCVWCDFASPHVSAFTYHLDVVHHRKSAVTPPQASLVCPTCPFESDSRPQFVRHERRCDKSFRLKRNLEPTVGDYDVPLKVTKYSQMLQRKAPAPVVRPPPAPRPVLRPPAHRLVAPGAPPAARLSQVVQVGRQFFTMVNQSGQTLLAPFPMNIVPPAAPMAPSYAKGSVSTILQQRQAPAAVSAPRALAPVSRAPLPLPMVTAAPRAFEICEICGGYVKDRASLRVHFYWAHRIELDADALLAGRQPHLWCDLCRQRFWTYQGLSRHRTTAHEATFPVPMARAPSQSSTDCSLCTCTKIVTMLHHLETCHGVTLDGVMTRRDCVACGAALGGSRASAQAHYLRAHPALLPSMLAEVNGQPPSDRAGQRTHADEWHCSRCESLQSRFGGLVEHVLNAHVYACPYCCRRMTSERVLEEHKRTAHAAAVAAIAAAASGQTCQVCRRRFAANREYVRHVVQWHLKRVTVDVTRVTTAAGGGDDDVFEVDEDAVIVEARGDALVLKRMVEQATCKKVAPR